MKTPHMLMLNQSNATGNPRFPQWVDIVEKVSAKKLWNQNLKRTNPGEWIIESTLRIFS